MQVVNGSRVRSARRPGKKMAPRGAQGRRRGGQAVVRSSGVQPAMTGITSVPSKLLQTNCGPACGSLQDVIRVGRNRKRDRQKRLLIPFGITARPAQSDRAAGVGHGWRRGCRFGCEFGNAILPRPIVVRRKLGTHTDGAFGSTASESAQRPSLLTAGAFRSQPCVANGGLCSAIQRFGIGRDRSDHSSKHSASLRCIEWATSIG
jgi:hypothetical protein